ncbi:MAG: hypothetical protein ACLQFR_09170 [Streptosporangiaceae bacterium]
MEVTSQAVVFAGVDLLDGTAVIDLKPYVIRLTGRRAILAAVVRRNHCH